MQKDNALIYYMGWAGASRTAEFMIPDWERYGLRIVIFTPEFSPLPPCAHEQINWGKNGPAGDAMYERVIRILEMFGESGAQFAILAEADSMCLLDRIVFRRGLYGTPQFRPYEQAPVFMAERYTTPPQMLDRDSAMAMLATARQYPEVREGGYSDRLLAALANLSGVPVLPYPEGSWSNATWSLRNPEGLELGMKESLRGAINLGCKWIHFVKTREQFDFVKACARCVR